MTSRDYQMITVYDYVKMLDGDIKYIDNNTRELRKNVAKYLLNIRRAQVNARILEEFDFADKIIRKLGCKTIDVTQRAIEDTALIIIKTLGCEKNY